MLRRLFLKSEAFPLSWGTRLLLVSLGVAFIIPLVTACFLTPDPEGKGYGTHEQMGFPPCTFASKTGFRCPSCGMTTSWTHFVRGRVDRAAMANSGGALLALIAAFTGPWALTSGTRGRYLWVRPTEITLVTMTFAVMIVTLVDWGFRLALE